MRHHCRRPWVLVSVLSVLTASLLTLTAVLFVWPSTNDPQTVNAIVVLGGSGGRIPKGIALVRAGYAPYLLVSRGRDQACPRVPDRVRVICFVPDPFTTQGEARATAKLASQHHWTRILVVSGTPQTTRARIRFKRCYHGTLLFDPANPSSFGNWTHNVIYEWGALFKALVIQRGC